MFSIGSAFAPYTIQPFLHDILNDTSVNTTWDEHYEEYSDMHDEVQYAYILVGSCCAFGSILFMLIFIVNGPTLMKTEHQKEASDANTDNVSLKPPSITAKVFLCAFLFLYFILMNGDVLLPGSYLPLFCVKVLGFSVQFGSTITSIFWGMLGVGRLIAVPLALCISQDIILNVYSILMVVGYILLFFVQSSGEAVLIASVVIAGFGVGPLFGGIFVWAAKYVPFSGFYSAVCFVGLSVGRLIMGLSMGYIFDTYDPALMVYIILGCSILHFVLFIVMQIFARCFMSTKVKKEQSEAVEMEWKL